MQAMMLDDLAEIESSPLQLRELPEPEPGPRDILIRVHCCAICRTDLHVIEGDLPRALMPIIPGHQIVGVVTGLGADAQRFQLGDRVGVAWLRFTCGTCRYCL